MLTFIIWWLVCGVSMSLALTQLFHEYEGQWPIWWRALLTALLWPVYIYIVIAYVITTNRGK